MKVSVTGLSIDLSDEFLETWLSKVCSRHGKRLYKLDIDVMSDEELLEVNREYLNHDYFTDIITFDYCFDKIVKGELKISLDRIIDNANRLKRDDELLRVIVHGVLHLCGYGDKTEDEKQMMRELEEEALKMI